MSGPHYRIVVRGRYEPVALTLSSMSGVELLRRTDSQLLFTISSTAVAVVRPTEDGSAAEIVVLDASGGMIASNFAELLRGQLGYDVSDPVQSLRGSRALSA
jgi:hypothetical protein